MLQESGSGVFLLGCFLPSYRPTVGFSKDHRFSPKPYNRSYCRREKHDSFPKWNQSWVSGSQKIRHLIWTDRCRSLFHSSKVVVTVYYLLLHFRGVFNDFHLLPQFLRISLVLQCPSHCSVYCSPVNSDSDNWKLSGFDFSDVSINKSE